MNLPARAPLPLRIFAGVVLAMAVALLGGAIRAGGLAAGAEDLAERWPASDTPTLVLVTDPACAACQRALADLEALEALRGAGVGVTVLRRSQDPPLPTGWDRGPLPAWIVVAPDGSTLAVRRGYARPERVKAWVRATLVGPSAPGRPGGPDH
jgi:hypothetical protein